MRARQLIIKNFRSIRSEVVDLGAQTAILGSNGAGKSTILRALEKFYGQATQVEPDDFFARNFAEPIEIGITFDSFADWEREIFGSRIQGDEMTVVRVFEVGARNTGRYHGMALQHPGFQPIQEADGAVAKRQVYNQIRDSGGIYADLPPATNAQQVTDGMAQWEALHPNACEPMRDDGQFFGFTNVAKGALNRASTLVFIPAVRDASADAMDSKGAVVAQLIELLVRSAIQRREDIRKWQEETSVQYRELTNPENLHELGALSGQLSETLKVFYRDAAVGLQWKPAADLNVPLPTADVLLDDDGFEGPVDRKGHGLQRALILTLLQHLAVAVSSADQNQEGVEIEDEAVAAAPLPEPQMPGLILAIEEPELYQHPTKQRHFSSVLSSLSSGALPGVATNTQVIFASHSPLFVSTDRFDEIRLARRRLSDDQEYKECSLSVATLDQIAKELEVAHARPAGSFNADGVRARLHIINPEVSEGFFADLVVLVEGPGDRAALLAAAGLLKVDLEGSGVAILPAGCKNNIDRPGLIFQAFDIPTYLIWDCDKGGDSKKANHALLRLSGVEEGNLFEAETRIDKRFACFENELEKTLEEEIPNLENYIDYVRVTFDIAKKVDVLKSAFAMREVLIAAASEGHHSATLEAIVHTIAERVAN